MVRPESSTGVGFSHPVDTLERPSVSIPQAAGDTGQAEAAWKNNFKHLLSTLSLTLRTERYVLFLLSFCEFFVPSW